MGRFVRMSAVVLAAVLAQGSMASDEQLRQVSELFDRQDYIAAHDALQRVDRAELGDEDRATYDHLASTLEQAVPGATRAAQDLADAEAAYDEGRWDDADGLYRAIAANRWASEEQIGRARSQRQRITEKRELARAAQPDGPVRDAAPIHRTDEPLVTTGGPQRLSVVEELRRRDELRWQQALAKMREAARQAREAVDERRFGDARQLVDQAVQVIDAARPYADPPSKYEQAASSAQDLKREIDDRIARLRVGEAALEQQQIADAVRARRESHERQRREKVEQLLGTAAQLHREFKHAEAAEAVRQVLYIEPGNTYAKFLLESYENHASYSNQAALAATQGRQMRGTLEESREALVPWYQDILYPKNWVELSARRLGPGAGFVFGPDGELNRLLDRPGALGEFRFEQSPLAQVMEHLAQSTQANFNVDWDDLAAHGIERDRPVSVSLRDVTYRTALRQVLDNLSAGGVDVDFSLSDGVVRVATRNKLDRNKHVAVYDIRDLLIDIPHFAGPQIDIARTLPGSTADDEASLFFDQPRARESDSLKDRGGSSASGEVVSRLLDIIRQTVAPDSWRENGGGDGALRELNGQLIVYNTSESHRQVSSLLDQLRETRALQIAVESRFLIVTSNFLEEIGVDLDFVFNSGTAGFDPAFGPGGGLRDNFTGAPVLIPRQFSRIGATPAVPPGVGQPIPQGAIFQPYGQAGLVPQQGGVLPRAGDFTPIPLQQGSLNLVNPQNINTGVPGSLGPSVISPAMNIAGSFLDNLQVDFLIRATQANRRSSIVQAPRLLMFNSQRAFVAIQRTRSYVSSLNPIVAEGAVGVAPVQAFIASGSVLDVEGTISADRRYVTLTVRTTLSEEPEFRQFTIQSPSGNSPGLFILLPDQQIRRINTTVSVPDGGTVLLGGLKQVGEVEIEAGVPVLSKIPVLKRAFTNATTVKDTQTLLILLKAKILIQREAEEDVFPTLSSAGI